MSSSICIHCYHYIPLDNRNLPIEKCCQCGDEVVNLDANDTEGIYLALKRNIKRSYAIPKRLKTGIEVRTE